MKSLGRKPTGGRLARMQDSPLSAGEGFRNIHPILPGLRDPTRPRVTLSEFLCGGGGERRVPRGPLPSSNPLDGVGLRWPATGQVARANSRTAETQRTQRTHRFAEKTLD